MSDEALRKELAYYKRHLDEMAALQILAERQGWVLRAQVRQKRQGFQLLSKLARSVGTQADLRSLLHVAAVEINSELAMHRTIVFTPPEGGPRYAPTVLVGFGDEEAERLNRVRLELPPELASGSGVVLASLSSEPTSTIEQLRSLSGLASFVFLPVSGPKYPLALFLSGRLREDATFSPALDEGDVDTFYALVRVLEAAIQDARLVRLEQTHRLKTELFANVSSRSSSGRSRKSSRADGDSSRTPFESAWKSFSAIRRGFWNWSTKSLISRSSKRQPPIQGRLRLPTLTSW